MDWRNEEGWELMESTHVAVRLSIESATDRPTAAELAAIRRCVPRCVSCLRQNC